MIATTIISSIRVKPFCSVLIWYSLSVVGESIGLVLYPTYSYHAISMPWVTRPGRATAR